jgi:hypothetical protein
MQMEGAYRAVTKHLGAPLVVTAALAGIELNVLEFCHFALEFQTTQRH